MITLQQIVPESTKRTIKDIRQMDEPINNLPDVEQISTA